VKGLELQIHREPHDVVDEAGNGDVRDRANAFEHFDPHLIPGPDAQDFAKHPGQHDTARRHLDRPAMLIDDSSQARVRRYAGQRNISLAVSGADAHGHTPLRFDGHHTGQPRECEPGVG
jgi:hypothetical protein